MATVRGVIRDSVSGASVEAKVHVLTSSGHFVHPADSILKIGPGDPFFYCSGEFSVDVPRGPTDIVVATTILRTWATGPVCNGRYRH